MSRQGQDPPDSAVATGATLTAPGATAVSVAERTDPGADLTRLAPVDRGNYVFAGQIARGGMGRILRARDRRLGREVAVKELIGNSPQLAVRFEREARITARLQHPSIVALYEAGTWPSGEPFYAMKLVAGRALDAVVGEARTLADRLALLPHGLAVADALAYAHARGVIHRDLKPANVLVGEFGETVVIDWGLAKELQGGDELASSEEHRGALHETAYGAVLGTPAYMPPEQARGEPVDQRADVYAIGALLYHMLSGRAPYHGQSSDEVLDKVLRERPRPLAAIAPEVPPDLSTIVGKAMARVPDDRYPSGRELADDLRRFLTGQLVGAHRYSAGALVRRWLRRRRAVVAVAAAALVVLAVVSTLSVRRILDERDAARRAEQAEAAQRIEAEAQRAASEDLVGFMLGDLHPQLERVGRLDLLGGVGEKVDAYYARLSASGGGGAKRADALHILGEVFDAAGDLDGARRAFTAALALRQPTEVVEIARTRASLAVTLQQAGEVDQAEVELGLARDALEGLPTRSPVASITLATAYRRLGAIATGRGELDAAAAALTLGLGHAEAAGPTGRAEAAKCHDRLSDVRAVTLELAEARREALAGLAIREQLADEDPGDLAVQYGLTVSWDKLFMLAIAAPDLAEADRTSAAQLAISEVLVARDPDNVDWSRMHFIAMLRPAELAELREDYRSAVTWTEKSLAFAERAAARHPGNLERLADLQQVLNKLGRYLLGAGDPQRAVAVLRRALATSQEISDQVPDNVTYRHSLAVAHEYMGDALSISGAGAEAAAAEYQARVAIDDELRRRDPDNPRRRMDLASSRFLYGRAQTEVPGRRAEGLAEVEAAMQALRDLAAAGELPGDAVALLPDYEQELVLARARVAAARP